MNKERIIEILKSIGAFIWGCALFVLYIAQILAYIKGLEVWFGFGWILQTIGIMLVLMIRGPIFGIAFAIIGFYGAWKGWSWQWWQATLLCLPFIVFIFFLSVLEGFERLWFYIKRKTPPPHS